MLLLSARAFIVAVGLSFSETMSGSYCFIGSRRGEGSLMFRIDAFSRNLFETLRTGQVAVTGYVEMEGVAKHAALEGQMTIKPLLARLIRYEFGFRGDDDSTYFYSGCKTIRHLRPKKTWTTLPGSIFDADRQEIATSVTRFDPEDLIPFLRSYRFPRLSA
ncbi:MAG: hypothetical protein ACE5E4_11910 [Candidatus Binatia bacterium]